MNKPKTSGAKLKPAGKSTAICKGKEDEAKRNKKKSVKTKS